MECSCSLEKILLCDSRQPTRWGSLIAGYFVVVRTYIIFLRISFILISDPWCNIIYRTTTNSTIFVWGGNSLWEGHTDSLLCEWWWCSSHHPLVFSWTWRFTYNGCHNFKIGLPIKHFSYRTRDTRTFRRVHLHCLKPCWRGEILSYPLSPRYWQHNLFFDKLHNTHFLFFYVELALVLHYPLWCLATRNSSDSFSLF